MLVKAVSALMALFGIASGGGLGLNLQKAWERK